MGNIPMTTVWAGAISLIISLAGWGIDLLRERRARKRSPVKSYQRRLSELTASLSRASGEVDAVLREVQRVATERAGSIAKMEDALAGLEQRERELKDRIDVLQKVPIAAAEQFAKLVEPGEKRSARRDWLIFFAGVVVTTVISVVLQLAFRK